MAESLTELAFVESLNLGFDTITNGFPEMMKKIKDEISRDLVRHLLKEESI